MIENVTRHSFKSTALGTAALLLAACAGVGGGVGGYKVYGEHYAAGYQYNDIAYYNGGREMAVDVLNTPFAVANPENFADRLAHSMRNKNEGAPIAFTAQRGPNTPADTRILIAFNTPSSDAGTRLCATDRPELASGEPPTRMLMVYCKRDRFMSSVRAEAPTARSLDDPNFQQMVAASTRLLMPIRLPGDVGPRRKFPS